MSKEYLLILRTKTPEVQQHFCTLLQQKEIVFRELYCQPGRLHGCRSDFIENTYLMEADFCSLSGLKKSVEMSIPFEALLLFEYVAW